MSKHIPFSVGIDEGYSPPRVVLTGDLTPSEAVRDDCAKVLKGLGARTHDLAIDATQARLPRGSVAFWISLVRECLSEHHLIYLPSQLSTILQFEDAYQHRDSEFSAPQTHAPL